MNDFTWNLKARER